MTSAKIVEGLETKTGAEIRELMKNTLEGWQDDMQDLLFSDN